MVKSINACLHALPGYKKDAIQHEKQEGVVCEQYDHLRTQLITIPNVESTRVLARVELLQSSDRSRVALPGGAETSRQEERRLCNALEQWVKNHPGDLMIFDSLASDSTLWETLALRLPHWQDSGVVAWVGARASADLPSGALRDRLLIRIPGAMHLD